MQKDQNTCIKKSKPVRVSQTSHESHRHLEIAQAANSSHLQNVVLQRFVEVVELTCQ